MKQKTKIFSISLLNFKSLLFSSYVLCAVIFFSLYTFPFSLLHAQEIIINDGTNSLVKIIDEGTFGSIQLKNGTPSNTTRKIYSVGGTLYYNGNPVHSSGISDNDWTIVDTNMYSNVAGFVGIHNSTPAYTLDVGGDINLTGRLFLNGSYGTPGQVLTTNGSSPPTWEDAAGNSIGFYAYQKTGTVEYPGGVENQLNDFTEHYDDGNGFNPTNGRYLPPSDGLYHFDVKVGYKKGAAVSAAATYILIKVNNTNKPGQKLVKRIWVTASVGESVLFSTNLKVLSTDIITFHFFFPSGNGLQIEGGNISEATTISGFKIK